MFLNDLTFNSSIVSCFFQIHIDPQVKIISVNILIILFRWPARYYGIIEGATTVFSVEHVGPHTKTMYSSPESQRWLLQSFLQSTQVQLSILLKRLESQRWLPQSLLQSTQVHLFSFQNHITFKANSSFSNKANTWIASH